MSGAVDSVPGSGSGQWRCYRGSREKTSVAGVFPVVDCLLGRLPYGTVTVTH